MSFFVRLIFFLCLPVLAQSQTNICGSNLDLLPENSLPLLRQFHQKARATELRNNQIDSIPVTIHQIRSAEGGNLIYEEMVRIIERANQEFTDLGLHFYICGSPRYLDGQPNYTFNEAEGLNYGQHVSNTINIYLVDGIKAPGGGLLCGLSKFPFQADPDERYIMLDKECAITEVTLVHELGHFYGLLHTHEDRFGRELVNGNNCHFAGDLICDTPADPNLVLPNSLYNCNYIGRRVDINGDLYRPSVQNFMSYAPPYCQQQFSRNQKSIMRAIIQEEYAYLQNGHCDIREDLSIEGQIAETQISALDEIRTTLQVRGDALSSIDQISLRIGLFETQDQKRGTALYEEVITLPMGASTQQLDLSLPIPEVKASGTYYLVAEIDADFELIEKTENNNRFIQKIRIDNAGFEDLTLFPNPAQELAYFFFRSPKTRGPYTIQLFRSDGVKVLSMQGTQVRNEVLRQLDVSRLPKGIYLANIEFKNNGIQRSLRFFKK
jgi:hypothetical protein